MPECEVLTCSTGSRQLLMQLRWEWDREEVWLKACLETRSGWEDVTSHLPVGSQYRFWGSGRQRRPVFCFCWQVPWNSSWLTFWTLTFKESQVCACVFYTVSLGAVAFTRSVNAMDGRGSYLDRLPDTSCNPPWVRAWWDTQEREDHRLGTTGENPGGNNLTVKTCFLCFA